jgi:ABC-2 type transport system permease protein
MNGVFLLLCLSLRRVRMLLIGMGSLLAGFQMLRVVMAASMQNRGELDHLSDLVPPVVRAVIGPAFSNVVSFQGLVCGAYYDLAIMISLVALTITVSTLPAGEIESGFADLVLARPVPRHWIVTRTIALSLISIAAMLSTIATGTQLGVWLFAPDGMTGPPLSRIAALAGNMGLLLLCWSGVAMALGAGLRRGRACGITALTALAALLLDYAARIWPDLDFISWLSPFHYFRPFEIVVGDPLEVGNAAIMAAIGFTGFVVAYYVISERDIKR